MYNQVTVMLREQDTPGLRQHVLIMTCIIPTSLIFMEQDTPGLRQHVHELPHAPRVHARRGRLWHGHRHWLPGPVCEPHAGTPVPRHLRHTGLLHEPCVGWLRGAAGCQARPVQGCSVGCCVLAARGGQGSHPRGGARGLAGWVVFFLIKFSN